MNIKKILYIIFGCISFGRTAQWAVILPVLPTFPFCFAALFSRTRLDKMV